MIYAEQPKDFVPDFGAVGCFVEAEEPKPTAILLLLKSPNGKFPLKWQCTSGGIEKSDKSTEDAMFRELREEAGLRVMREQLKKIGVFFVDFNPPKFIYTVFRLVFPFRTEIKISDKHCAYLWIPPSCVKSLDSMQDLVELIQLVYGC